MWAVLNFALAVNPGRFKALDQIQSFFRKVINTGLVSNPTVLDGKFHFINLVNPPKIDQLKEIHQ